MSDGFALPLVPVKHSNFIQYVKTSPGTSIPDLLRPYNEYDSIARRIFAQDRDLISEFDGLFNLVPLFTAEGYADLEIRARDPATEPSGVRSKYLLPLSSQDRRPSGTRAVVSTIHEFKANFDVFCEGSLRGLDWNNVIVAGSAVTSTVLPVPAKYAQSREGLRRFFHEDHVPTSDVDIFLYGLSEQQAIEKIREIEKCIRDSTASEILTVRTKNAVTIVSQYPTRHVQIILRLYSSISEVLTGFDVDCACAAYNGHQVYLAPRAIGAYITQCNRVDLTRRSPSYENRLFKYSRRGFEVFWPDLDRARVNPAIFDAFFPRVTGLARLLVLERFPKGRDHNEYARTRELEQRLPCDVWSRPPRDWMVKAEDPEVADDSNYQTISIPYGKNYNAQKIRKLLHDRDLFLNTQGEWNPDRVVDLHRHPAFFGDLEDIFHDCCRACPEPATSQEKELAAVESKHYVSGNISFLQDNPGRQEIGSFHPIVAEDWTGMAYVGKIQSLCEAIVARNPKAVQTWLAQESGINDRDHFGRTPLHLAAMASTPEIVRLLVENGSLLTATLTGGRNALHLAASRGDSTIIRILLSKSRQNMELRSSLKGEARSYPVTTHRKLQAPGTNLSPSTDTAPDVYDIDALTPDKFSPLHLAVLLCHEDAVEELVAGFGANIGLPVRALVGWSYAPIWPLVLALTLPTGKAKSMTIKLLSLGATLRESDKAGRTPLYYLANSVHHDILGVYLRHDREWTKRSINFQFACYHNHYVGVTVLNRAILNKNPIMAGQLLEAGAHPTVTFKTALRAHRHDAVSRWVNQTPEGFYLEFVQPIVCAVEHDLPSVAIELLFRGADPNALTPAGYSAIKHAKNNHLSGSSILDLVRRKIVNFRSCEDERAAEVGIGHLLRDYERLEEELLYLEAKPFQQLYPNIQTPPTHASIAHDDPPISQDTSEYRNNAMSQKRKYNALDSPSDSQMKYNAKLLLYAARVGHRETIKKIALAEGGSGPCLLTSVSDQSGNSAFALAVLRGHLDVARFIFALLIEKYNENSRDDTTQQRNHGHSPWMNETSIGSSNTGGRDGDSVSLDRPQIIKRGMGSKSDPRLQLEGYCCPEAALVNSTALNSRRCTLFDHAVFNNDVPLLSFLIQLGRDMVAKQNGSDLTYHVPDGVLLQVIRLGRQHCLEEIVKCAGAGLIEHLQAPTVDKEARSEKRRYEGLFGSRKQNTESTMTLPASLSPPLLLAARQGKLEAAQWFLGSAPRHLYTEFVMSNGHVKSLQGLINSQEGPGNLLGDWLSSKNELVLHCAVLSRATDESERLVQYLIREMPHCLETRSSDGYTALAVAFRCHQLEFARLLIEAGADQRVRDRKGRNLVHLLFARLNCPSHDDLRRIQNLLDLINPLLVSSLLTQRSSSQLGLLTPLAYLMSKGFQIDGQTESNLSALKIGLCLAENTNQQHLEVFDGVGDTPLHRAVKGRWDKVLAMFISYRYDLLVWENAIGATPIDLARDLCAPAILSAVDNMRSGIGQNAQRIFEMCQKGYAQSKEFERKLFTPAALDMVVTAFAKKQKSLTCETDEVGRWIQDRTKVTIM